MPRAFYYATNTRMAKDIMQYLLHPAFKAGAYMSIRAINPHISAEAALDTADVVTSIAGGTIYSLNTATFQGIESQFMDKNARTAVAAELGKDKDELKFSDYLDSSNVIIQHELADAKKVNKIRYMTDALFFVPAAMYALSSINPKFKEVYQKGRLSRSKPTEDMGPGHIALGAFNLWDTSIYGSKAAYWMYETYKIPKSAHYEIVKLDETIESTGKKFTPNDLIAVVNRSREDRGLSQIKEKNERNELWKVLEHLADKMNNNPHFGMSELTYLVGLNKINIFELDQQGNEMLDENNERIICKDNIKKTIAEIDRVTDLGLDGIAEQNKKAHEISGEKGLSAASTQIGSTLPEARFKMHSQAERDSMDRAFATTSAIRNMFSSLVGGAPRQRTDYISPRDGISVNVTSSR